MEPSTAENRENTSRSQDTDTELRDDPSKSSAGLQVVDTGSDYSKATLTEPTTRGYIHIGAAVRPYTLPLTPFMPTGRRKAELIGRLKELGRQLELLDVVKTVTIFEAVALPPLHRLPYIRERADSLHLARFDVTVLIETTSPTATRDVQGTPTYQTLVDVIRREATDVHATAARNAKRIGDVDKTRPGLFIFNHFVAEDAAVMRELFDYLAGGYVTETGLDNSTLLVPLEDENADYVAINNARWDVGVARFLWQELTNKSLRNYVQTNLKANQVGAMPVLYRLA